MVVKNPERASDPQGVPKPTVAARKPGSGDPWIGQVLDQRYRIIELLGRGGMGTVYKAEHIGISKPVAVKLFSPRTSNITSGQKRFSREAFASARVEHPNCVVVSDFGTLEDGSLYIAMELLRGIPLNELIKAEGPLEVARALRIVKHILAGLEAAHESGIVHRDLKPHNVILIEWLGDKDFAKILDFGLAKLMGSALEDEGGGKLTAVDTTFGTPKYMAPEQATGKEIDHRADLYSVSVILYELIAGRPPFVHDNPVKLVMMHATEPIPPLAKWIPDNRVPRAVEELILTGLSKKPKDRMGTATEYLAAIDHLLELTEDRNRPKGREISGNPVLSPPPAAVGHGRQAVATVPDNESSGGPVGESKSKALVRSLERLTGSVKSLASYRSSKKKYAIFVLFIVAVIILANLMSSEDAPRETSPSLPSTAKALMEKVRSQVATDSKPPTAEEGEPLAQVPGFEEALQLVGQRRKSRAAEKILRTLHKKHPSNALICYTMGGLFYERPWPKEAMKYYRKAIELYPPYREDTTIIGRAVELLTSTSGYYAAAVLLEQVIGEPAIPSLKIAAESDRNEVKRRRAAAILEKLDK